MLQACTGIPIDAQLYQNCCHLEGEAAVEIRIAWHPSGPQIDSPHLRDSPQDPYLSTPGGSEQGGSIHTPVTVGTFPKDAEKPPMPQGSRQLRTPASANFAWTHKPPSGGKNDVGDGFDADTFAAPLDTACGRPSMHLGVGASFPEVKQFAESGLFPEALRSPRTQPSDTHRPFLIGAYSSGPKCVNPKLARTADGLSHPPEPVVPQLQERAISDGEDDVICSIPWVATNEATDLLPTPVNSITFPITSDDSSDGLDV